jgi:cytochrome c peroxidase
MSRTIGTAFVALFGAVALAAVAPRPAACGDGRNDVAAAELGRRLFFDPAISRSGTNSCASCHDPDHGWSSRNAHDDDDFTPNPRHTHTLVDAALRAGVLHWDGEYARVAQLVLDRLGTPSAAIAPYRHAALRVPGFNDVDRPLAKRSDPSGAGGPSTTPGTSPDPASPPAPGSDIFDPPRPKDDHEAAAKGFWVDPLRGVTPPHLVAFRDDSGRRHVLDLQQVMPVCDRVERDGRYAGAFEAAFGSPSVTLARISVALQEFVETIRSNEAPFDRYAAGREDAISASARRGFALFKKEAGCARCHLLGSGRAPFTDLRYHVTGIVARSYGGKLGIDSDEQVREVLDTGHERLSRSASETRAFRTPSLRDVARRGPWMHDGSMTSLEDVVRHYAGGAVPDPHLDPLLVKGFEVSPRDVRDLTAFLESLTSDFRPGIAPDFADRAATTRVRVVDDLGRPMTGVRVHAIPAGDRLPGDVPALSPERELVSDDEGRFEFEAPRRTHTRLILPDGLRAPQGEWVPDTCRRLELRIPVAGRASLVVAGLRQEEVRDLLLVPVPPLEKDTLRPPPAGDARIPLPPAIALNARKVHFVRQGVAAVGGATLVRYEAWVPSKAPAKGVVSFLSGSSRVTRVVSLVPGAETRIDLRDP